MASYGSNGVRLRAGNYTSRMANLTPPVKTQSRLLDDMIGILRWVGLGIEILGTIAATIIPGAQPLIPLIAIGGALFQGALDTISYVNDEKTVSRSVSYGISMFLNVASLGISLKTVYGASKNVLRVVDDKAKDGFRYILRGSEEFNEAGKAFLASGKTGNRFKSVQRITIKKEQELIRKGIIKPYTEQKVWNEFEIALQQEFKSTQIQKRQLASYRGQEYYSKKGQYLFTNRDMAIVRNGIKNLSIGKIGAREFVRKELNKLSSTAKEVLQLEKLGRNAVFKSPELEGQFMKRIDRLTNLYGSKLKNEIVDIAPKNWWEKKVEKFYEWLSTKKGYTFFGTSKGHKFTQLAQSSNPNDIARELENRAEGIILNGFKGKQGTWLENVEFKGLRAYTKQIREYMQTQFPRLAEIVKNGFKTKTFKMYKEIKENIEKHGVKTKDDTFLMGWRVVNYSKHFSEVIFYFNPKNTRAKTAGSKNYGGKKPVHTILPTPQLNTLSIVNDPGKMYLKGGHGYTAIALSPGGKRGLDYEISSDIFALITLTMPIEPLRNILSVVSNVKSTIVNLSKGTYGARFVPILRNTLERLIPNKITKIAGVALGGVISQELGQHLSRTFKGALQGFQRTTTTTKVVNGHKLKFTRTSFSFSNTFKPTNMIKQMVGQNVLSASMKRLPKASLDTPSTTRLRLKSKRYGTQLRRIAGVYKI